MASAMSLRQQLPRGLAAAATGRMRDLRRWRSRHVVSASVLGLLACFVNRSSTLKISVLRPPVAAPLQSLSLSTSRACDLRSQGLRLQAEQLAEVEEEAAAASPKRSRNERKREARRAVLWGMSLASFSASEIKLVLRAASLDREVFEALMLVKRLGPDVREGRRRQYNYIGKLLRSAEPDLMDALIEALKDGDKAKLQVLSGEEIETFEEEEEEEEEETEYDDEVSYDYVEIATRWFDGLIDKDSSITKEVYAVDSIDFDRQELRKLVRRVHSIQERPLEDADENQANAALNSAKKSLRLFLRSLAKKTSATEWT